MVHLDQWGPLRHAANAAWICLQVSLIIIPTRVLLKMFNIIFRVEKFF
jgi:hypothetical protein